MSATDCTATEVVEAISIPDLTALIAGYVDEPAENCAVCNAEAFRAAGPTCNCSDIYRVCEDCGEMFFHAEWVWESQQQFAHTRLANGRIVTIEEWVAFTRHPHGDGRAPAPLVGNGLKYSFRQLCVRVRLQ